MSSTAGIRLLPWLAGLDRDGRVERLTLSRFDRAQLEHLLAAILGDVTPRNDLVDDVFDRSDGNPFFAEELLAASRQGSGGPVAHATDAPRDPAGDLAISTPVGIASCAWRRRRSAVSIMSCSPRWRACPTTGSRRASAPRSAGHLLVVESVSDTDRYAFRHALVQEVVYDELLPGERRSPAPGDR